MALLLVVGFGAADVPFPRFFGLLGSLAGWGGLGGLVLSGVVRLAAGPGGELLVLGPVFALAGAVSASGTLALARRAERQSLLEASPEATEAVGA
jgi:hypothetical protein